MSYYQDLSPYEYAQPEPNTLNIGWLSRRHEFPQGETGKEFQDRLRDFCSEDYVVHLMLGFHPCPFCPTALEKRIEPPMLNLGNGEIRVIGALAIYSAPTLIYHYVVAHNYKPPDEFVQAVLSGPAPGSKQHIALLKQLDRARRE